MSYTKVTDNTFTSSFSSTIRACEAKPVTTSTMTCIALSDELVFVDCGLSSRFAVKFRKDMEEKFHRRTSHLLLTHLHRDHYWAMGAFKDVNVVASRKEMPYLKRTLKNVESRKGQWAGKYIGNEAMAKAIIDANLFLPNISVKEKLAVGSDNGVIFQVIGGHSAGSALYIHLQREFCAQETTCSRAMRNCSETEEKC